MITFTSKNGIVFKLRKAIPSDAKSIIDFYNFIGGETDYLSFGKNEYPLSIDEQHNNLIKMQKETKNFMLLALDKAEIAGIITIDTPKKRKYRHNASLGIGIKLKYCNSGLGTYMIKQAIESARHNKICKKIHLVTRDDNERAISVYKKCGFITEGILKNDSFENGKFYDNNCMAIFL